MAADLTPRPRKLRATNGVVIYHPCTHVMPDGSYCGKEAPYGYDVRRQSRGVWVTNKATKEVAWKGHEAEIQWGYWRCSGHKI